MRYLSASIVSDAAYLIPIGDVHVGDKAFGRRARAKLQGYLDWVAERDNARIFLMGDIYNTASRHSKTSPFETNPEEYELARELFTPVKDRILGAIDGNHEARMLDLFGHSPTQDLCAGLGIPYCGWSAVLELSVGNLLDRDGRPRQNTYYILFHHTTGGGQNLGGALNRSVKLQDIVQGIDVYCGGHNHQLVTGVRTVLMPHPRARRMREHKVTYVDCGSYLEWDGSYAEAKQLPMGKLGSPRIRFAGARHVKSGVDGFWDSRDVHVSLGWLVPLALPILSLVTLGAGWIGG